MSYDRAEVLLRACFDLLKAQDKTHSVNVLEESVYYDGYHCDGYCLLNDIKDWLESNREGNDI